MNKKKINEMYKVATASLLSVGLFGTLLFGAGALAFANASDRTLELPPLEPMSAASVDTIADVLTDDYAALAENILKADDTLESVSEEMAVRHFVINEAAAVSWWHTDSVERSEEMLTAQEAADIAANQIYAQYGECIDGTVVQMIFNGHMEHRGFGGVWVGTVGDGIIPEDFDIETAMPWLIESPEGLDEERFIGTPMFIFMINATSGELIHLEHLGNALEGGAITLINLTGENRITIDSTDVSLSFVEAGRGATFREFAPGDAIFREIAPGDIVNYGTFVFDTTLEPFEISDELLEELRHISIIALPDGSEYRLEEITSHWEQELGEGNFRISVGRRVSMIPRTFGP